jgi:S-adenosylmethionine/arginine decarboxylase-like enzyme
MTGTIYHHAYWIAETQPKGLRNHYAAALAHAGFKVVGFTDHHFEPVGYTAVWLLAESHLALHTFPEEGRTYVELTSCNQSKLDAFLAWEALKENPVTRGA